MNSITEHNQALQHNGHFTEADLEANRQRRFSDSQLKRFEVNRSSLQQSVEKHEDKYSPVPAIIIVGLILLAVALDVNGHLEVLDKILGGLFLPIMLCLLLLVLIFTVFIIPRQLLDSVESYSSFEIPVTGMPPGVIQVIESQAKVYRFPGAGHPHNETASHTLQMGTVRFQISPSLGNVIQQGRSYRVYAVYYRGTWVLLSMEAGEDAAAAAFLERQKVVHSGAVQVDENHRRT